LASETETKQIRKLKYETPASLDGPKAIVNMLPGGSSEILRFSAQVVRPKDGETNMHAHPALDSVWFVLSGSAKFYGFGDVLAAEAGQNEGVFIPKGVPYWFEASSDVPLEILHITATDRNIANERVNYAAVSANQYAAESIGNARRPTEEELRAAEASAPRN
jgi:mannose-6-phosphate isomerase-like protein (cupin superfamily)